MRSSLIALLLTSSCGSHKDEASDKVTPFSSTIIWEYEAGVDWVEYRGRQYIPSPQDRDRSWQDDWSGPLVLSGPAIADLQWVSTCATIAAEQTKSAPLPKYVAMVPWYLSMIENDLSEKPDPLFDVLGFMVSNMPRTSREREEETEAWNKGIGARHEYLHRFAEAEYLRTWQPVPCSRSHADAGSTYIERVTHEFNGNSNRLVGELRLGGITGTGTVTWHGPLLPYNQWEIGRMAALSCAWLNSNAPDMDPDAASDTSPSQRVANEARRSQMALLNYLAWGNTPFRFGFYIDISTHWKPTTASSHAKGRAEGTFLTALDALRLNGGWSCDAREGKQPYFFTVLR